MKQQAQGHILITAGNVTPYDAMQINEWTYPNSMYVSYTYYNIAKQKFVWKKKILSNKAVPTNPILYITEYDYFCFFFFFEIAS